MLRAPKRLLVLAGLSATMSMPSYADKRISILNANFRTKSPGGETPKDWVVKIPQGANLYRVDQDGFQVVALFGTGAQMEQSFLSREATADKYSTYYITFDAGWRNNAEKNQVFSLIFEIVNMTDERVLGKAVYVIPPNEPSNKYDDYRCASKGTTVRISYDNTRLDLRGDEIALRITSTSTKESENIQISHQLTGWIDNIFVRAAK